MVTTTAQVRPAVETDQRQLADLMFSESRLHRHLDWRAPLDWLGSPHYWVMEDHGQVQAALACPQDPPGVAWIRLFVYNAHLSEREAWLPLWQAVHDEILAAGGASVAAIAVKSWFQELLQASGFSLRQSILLLELAHPTPAAGRIAPASGGMTDNPTDPIRVRQMTVQDLPEVAAVDADAFDPLWMNTLAALHKAYSLALHASVVEASGRVIGYQISTGNPTGGHLGRLAVRREAQGRGVGEALVADLIRWLQARGLLRLTVNTQADNAASLNLYKKMGFVQTGEVYPVFVHRVQVLSNHAEL